MHRNVTIFLVLALCACLAGCATWRSRDLGDNPKAGQVLEKDLNFCRTYADDQAGNRPSDRDPEGGLEGYRPPQNFKQEYADDRQRDEIFNRCMGGRGWERK